MILILIMRDYNAWKILWYLVYTLEDTMSFSFPDIPCKTCWGSALWPHSPKYIYVFGRQCPSNTHLEFSHPLVLLNLCTLIAHQPLPMHRSQKRWRFAPPTLFNQNNVLSLSSISFNWGFSRVNIGITCQQYIPGTPL